MPAKREQILWENVWTTAERLERSFSLKAILSAGVMLFDQLTGDDQKDAIAKVNDKSNKADNVRELLRTIGQMSDEESGKIIKFLTPEESKALRTLRELFGPEPKKRKAKGG